MIRAPHPLRASIAFRAEGARCNGKRAIDDRQRLGEDREGNGRSVNYGLGTRIRIPCSLIHRRPLVPRALERDTSRPSVRAGEARGVICHPAGWCPELLIP